MGHPCSPVSPRSGSATPESALRIRKRKPDAANRSPEPEPDYRMTETGPRTGLGLRAASPRYEPDEAAFLAESGPIGSGSVPLKLEKASKNRGFSFSARV